MSLWDTITNFIPPLKTATELFNVAVGKESMAVAQQKIGTSLAITGGTAAAIAVSPSLAKSIASSSTGTKIGLAIASPAIIGAGYGLLSNPTQTASKLSSYSSASFDFGQQASSLAVNPSVSGAKDLFQNHPYITSAVGLAGVGAVGLGTAGIVSNIVNTQAVKANTKVMQEGTQLLTGDNVSSSATNKYDVQVIEEQAKAQQKLTESQTKAQLDILDAQTKQQKELLGQQIELQRLSSQSSPVATATASSPVAVKATKKKKKTTKKKQAKKKPIRKKKSKKTSKSSKKRKI